MDSPKQAIITAAIAASTGDASDTLNLTEAGLGPDGAVFLSARLRELPHLTALHLKGNYFGEAGFEALAPVLLSLENLTLLDLEASRIGGKASVPVLAGLVRLTSLNLCGCTLRSEGGSAFAAAALPQLVNLTSLNLGGCELDGEAAHALAAVLPRLARLSSLKLNWNKLAVVGAREVAAVLPQLAESLTELDLGLNELGTEGAEALATALASMVKLRALNLSSNAIGDVGARAIVEALARSESVTSLTELDIGSNGLSNLGAYTVVNTLGRLVSLTSLNLCGIDMGSEACLAVAALLPLLPHLTVLGVDQCGLGKGYLVNIVAVLGAQLQTLNLSCTCE